MSYVIAATYVAQAGEAEGVLAALAGVAPLSLQEPACISYRAHRSVEDPNTFFIYEEYEDEAGFAAHSASPHFARYIKGEAWPRLASRTVVRARPLTGAA